MLISSVLGKARVLLGTTASIAGGGDGSVGHATPSIRARPDRPRFGLIFDLFRLFVRHTDLSVESGGGGI